MADSRKRAHPANARETALQVLTRIEQDRSYSNLLLNQALQGARLEAKDAALTTELVYGTLQRLSTLDYFLARFVAKGVSSLQPWVRSLLRLSLYQLLYLDRIPAHAAVNEAVDIAKRRGHAGISGMVNGVLRNVLRQKDELVIPNGLSPVARIALQHAHPEWMVARWVSRFGEAVAERICEANNSPPPQSLRVNSLRTDRHALIADLQEDGCQAEPSRVAPAGVRVAGGGNLAFKSGYREGKYSIQDESSMLVAEAVAPEPGMRVLDCCAAPGGKTTHLAELMGDRGTVIGCDLHEHKEKLIREQANRLGLTCVETVAADAAKLHERYGVASFDRILLDAPCSGLGVIRRKPDLKWSKQEADLASAAALQLQLLAAVHPLLKPGGVLVYSTCTISEEENEQVIDAFLGEHPEFKAESMPDAMVERLGRGQDGRLQLLPCDFGSDGFFIVRLRRAQEAASL